jgi:hypothetical protein
MTAPISESSKQRWRNTSTTLKCQSKVMMHIVVCLTVKYMNSNDTFLDKIPNTKITTTVYEHESVIILEEGKKSEFKVRSILFQIPGLPLIRNSTSGKLHSSSQFLYL